MNRDMKERASVGLSECTMETGDLLFFKGDDPESRFIENASNSLWSHTGMVFKTTKGFLRSCRSFFRSNASYCKPIDSSAVMTAEEFRKFVKNETRLRGALKEELRNRSLIDKGKIVDERSVYLWESTENDKDPCRMTGKVSPGVKLTKLRERAAGYGNIVGHRKLISKDKNTSPRNTSTWRLTESESESNVSTKRVYVGILYSMYLALGKDYEKTYWDLVVCWIYDFKYLYGFCENAENEASSVGCLETVFPSCFRNDYNYSGEYDTFYCAELACLTLRSVMSRIELRNKEELSVESEPSSELPFLSSRTVVSIEYLIAPKSFPNYIVGPLKIYSHLSWRIKRPLVSIRNKSK